MGRQLRGNEEVRNIYTTQVRKQNLHTKQEVGKEIKVDDRGTGFLISG